MNKQYNKTDVNSWLNKAKDDLKWANASLKGGFNSQTCFVAQQVAEKSLKAFFYKRSYQNSGKNCKIC